MVLELMATALSLRSVRNRSLLLIFGARGRLVLLPLSFNTHVLDAPRVIHFPFDGQDCPDHRVPSFHVCRRMMYLKPLEVTRSSLALRCTSLCKGSGHSTCLRNDGSRSTNSLQESLLIKGWWWLVVASWETPLFPSLTCHLRMSNGKLRFLSPCSISSACATTNRS